MSNEVVNYLEKRLQDVLVHPRCLGIRIFGSTPVTTIPQTIHDCSIYLNTFIEFINYLEKLLQRSRNVLVHPKFPGVQFSMSNPVTAIPLAIHQFFFI